MISNNQDDDDDHGHDDDDDDYEQQQQQQKQQNNKEVIVKIKKRIKYYLYCLDFDGVLCDSVNETFYSGLRACTLLWSTSTSTNTNTDDKSKEEEKEKEEKNGWLIRLLNDPIYQNHILNDFRYIRPILYVGWESILLIKLLCTSSGEAEATATSTPTSTATSTSITPPVREKILRYFHHNNSNNDDDEEECSSRQQHDNTNKTFTKEYVMEKWKFTEKQYSIAMSDARKSWIKEVEGEEGGEGEDKDNELELEKGDSSSSTTTTTTKSSSSSSWIDAHGFYDGACQSVRNYLNNDNNNNNKNNDNDKNEDDVYIITTKAKQFALKLLQKQNLVQPQQPINVLSASASASIPSCIKESNVYGLGSGPKADVIKKILYERNQRQHQHQRQRQNNDNDSNNDSSNNEYDYEYEYIAIMVEDNIATLDKIMNKSSSLSLEEEEEEDIIIGSGNNNKVTVIPVVASWGYNTHEQLVNVINNNKYLVLPPSLLPPPLLPASLLPLPLPLALTTNDDDEYEYEDNKDDKDKVIIFQKNQNQNQIMSSKEKAKYCKETDPTGSSLSIIFHNYRNN